MLHRTQDGSIVNLQSLCSRTAPQPLQANPTTIQPTQKTLPPQTALTQVNVPAINVSYLEAMQRAIQMLMIGIKHTASTA